MSTQNFLACLHGPPGCFLWGKFLSFVSVFDAKKLAFKCWLCLAKDKRGWMIFNHVMNFVPPRPGEMAFLSRVDTTPEAEAYDAWERQIVELLAVASAGCKGQESSKTPLMSAIDASYLAAVRTLLRLGADFTIKDKDGNKAIYYMIGHRWNGPLPVDLHESFLTHGGDPNFETHLPGTQPSASCPI